MTLKIKTTAKAVVFQQIKKKNECLILHVSMYIIDKCDTLKYSF